MILTVYFMLVILSENHQGERAWPRTNRPLECRLSRRKLLQAGAATLGAAAFSLPAIAQTKPFAGVTVHGASFQHHFFTLLQNYIPEFEAQTGMKVDLQLLGLSGL